MSTYKDRLEELIDNKGITPYYLSQATGVSQATISRLRSDATAKPSIATNKKIADYFNVNADWLISGIDSTSPDASPTPLQVESDSKGAIPVYANLAVSAGQLDLARSIQGQEPTGWMRLSGIDGAIGAFPVIGCSMEPEIKQGDIVVIKPVDRWERIDPDKIYMVITRDDRMIKHLYTDDTDDTIFWCVSSNYPKFKIQKDEIIEIYRVVFHGRFS